MSFCNSPCRANGLRSAWGRRTRDPRSRSRSTRFARALARASASVALTDSCRRALVSAHAVHSRQGQVSASKDSCDPRVVDGESIESSRRRGGRDPRLRGANRPVDGLPTDRSHSSAPSNRPMTAGRPVVVVGQSASSPRRCPRAVARPSDHAHAADPLGRPSAAAGPRGGSCSIAPTSVRRREHIVARPWLCAAAPRSSSADERSLFPRLDCCGRVSRIPISTGRGSRRRARGGVTCASSDDGACSSSTTLCCTGYRVDVRSSVSSPTWLPICVWSRHRCSTTASRRRCGLQSSALRRSIRSVQSVRSSRDTFTARLSRAKSRSARTGVVSRGSARRSFYASRSGDTGAPGRPQRASLRPPLAR